ncbi:hypothetical protein M407DRAFT_243703 [Tulasnella calospora MUT 4182]|uniref:Aminoglycoside phosphotransferase domain-containing protein n=1 Tax=Tulasnella calospora MUT 4182 TaxID=1051891 RepID=A0A0C3LYG5_9AGAM|nr:hypothetical protein M407DRAFT_243703 [Tulasnella calospora MUT 4182]
MTFGKPDISAMTTDELAIFEAAIVSACTAHELAHWREDGYRRCVEIEQFFVKFDDYEYLEPEVTTQTYVSQYAESDASAPRVAKILHFFKGGQRMGYAVMEYINLVSPPVPEKVAEALEWLRKVPVPRDHVGIGPLGNGLARHQLFKNYKAPLRFSSINALELYLNKALTKRPRRSKTVTPVSLSGERLVFTQSDVDESNFGIDDEGKTVLLDFAEVGILPESFASHTMSSIDPFTVAVAKCLTWPDSPNLYSMSVIGYLLWMLHDPSLGLDKDGNSL